MNVDQKRQALRPGDSDGVTMFTAKQAAELTDFTVEAWVKLDPAPRGVSVFPAERFAGLRTDLAPGRYDDLGARLPAQPQPAPLPIAIAYREANFGGPGLPLFPGYYTTETASTEFGPVPRAPQPATGPIESLQIPAGWMVAAIEGSYCGQPHDHPGWFWSLGSSLQPSTFQTFTADTSTASLTHHTLAVVDLRAAGSPIALIHAEPNFQGPAMPVQAGWKIPFYDLRQKVDAASVAAAGKLLTEIDQLSPGAQVKYISSRVAEQFARWQSLSMDEICGWVRQLTSTLRQEADALAQSGGSGAIAAFLHKWRAQTQPLRRGLGSLTLPPGLVATLHSESAGLPAAEQITFYDSVEDLSLYPLDSDSTWAEAGWVEIHSIARYPLQSAPPLAVLLRTQPDFQGHAVAVSAGRYDDPRLLIAAIQSLEIPKGLEVILFDQAGCRGRSCRLTADTPKPVWSGTVGSFVVVDTRPDSPSIQDWVVAFAGAGQTGEAWTLAPGGIADVAGEKMKPPVSMSIPPGVQVQIYAETGFAGGFLRVKESGDLPVGDSGKEWWSNEWAIGDIGSLVVARTTGSMRIPPSYSVTLFDRPGCAGHWITVEGDVGRFEPPQPFASAIVRDESHRRQDFAVVSFRKGDSRQGVALSHGALDAFTPLQSYGMVWEGVRESGAVSEYPAFVAQVKERLASFDAWLGDPAVASQLVQNADPGTTPVSDATRARLKALLGDAVGGLSVAPLFEAADLHAAQAALQVLRHKTTSPLLNRAAAILTAQTPAPRKEPIDMGYCRSHLATLPGWQLNVLWASLTNLSNWAADWAVNPNVKAEFQQRLANLTFSFNEIDVPAGVRITLFDETGLRGKGQDFDGPLAGHDLGDWAGRARSLIVGRSPSQGAAQTKPSADLAPMELVAFGPHAVLTVEFQAGLAANAPPKPTFGGAPLPRDGWHHLAVRRQDAQWTWFLDGRVVKTEAGYDASLARSYDVVIGKNLRGEIGTLAIFREAKSDTRIREGRLRLPAPSGMAAWHFEEAEGYATDEVSGKSTDIISSAYYVRARLPKDPMESGAGFALQRRIDQYRHRETSKASADANARVQRAQDKANALLGAAHHESLARAAAAQITRFWSVTDSANGSSIVMCRPDGTQTTVPLSHHSAPAIAIDPAGGGLYTHLHRVLSDVTKPGAPIDMVVCLGVGDLARLAAASPRERGAAEVFVNGADHLLVARPCAIGYRPLIQQILYAMVDQDGSIALNGKTPDYPDAIKVFLPESVENGVLDRFPTGTDPSAVRIAASDHSVAWTDGRQIRLVRPTGNPVLVPHGVCLNPVALAFDGQTGWLYWADRGLSAILGVNPAGEVRAIYPAVALRSALAVDSAMRRLYWNAENRYRLEALVAAEPGPLCWMEDWSEEGNYQHVDFLEDFRASNVDRRTAPDAKALPATHRVLHFGGDTQNPSYCELGPVYLECSEGFAVEAYLALDGSADGTLLHMGTEYDITVGYAAKDHQLFLEWRVPLEAAPRRVTAPAPAGGWFHLVASIAPAGDAHVWIDGQERTQGTGAQVIGFPPTRLRAHNFVGAESAEGGKPFAGRLAMLRVWNLHLGPDEVAHSYAQPFATGASAPLGIPTRPMHRQLMEHADGKSYLMSGSLDGSTPAVALFPLAAGSALFIESQKIEGQEKLVAAQEAHAAAVRQGTANLSAATRQSVAENARAVAQHDADLQSAHDQVVKATADSKQQRHDKTVAYLVEFVRQAENIADQRRKNKEGEAKANTDKQARIDQANADKQSRIQQANQDLSHAQAEKAKRG